MLTQKLTTTTSKMKEKIESMTRNSKNFRSIRPGLKRSSLPDQFLDRRCQLDRGFGGWGDGLIVAGGLGGSRGVGEKWPEKKYSTSEGPGILTFKLDQFCEAGQSSCSILPLLNLRSAFRIASTINFPALSFFRSVLDISSLLTICSVTFLASLSLVENRKPHS